MKPIFHELREATAYVAKHSYSEDREKYRAALEVMKKHAQPKPEPVKKSPWTYVKPERIQ